MAQEQKPTPKSRKLVAQEALSKFQTSFKHILGDNPKFHYSPEYILRIDTTKDGSLYNAETQDIVKLIYNEQNKKWLIGANDQFVEIETNNSKTLDNLKKDAPGLANLSLPKLQTLLQQNDYQAIASSKDIQNQIALAFGIKLESKDDKISNHSINLVKIYWSVLNVVAFCCPEDDTNYSLATLLTNVARCFSELKDLHYYSKPYLFNSTEFTETDELAKLCDLYYFEVADDKLIDPSTLITPSSMHYPTVILVKQKEVYQSYFVIKQLFMMDGKEREKYRTATVAITKEEASALENMGEIKPTTENLRIRLSVILKSLKNASLNKVPLLGPNITDDTTYELANILKEPMELLTKIPHLFNDIPGKDSYLGPYTAEVRILGPSQAQNELDTNIWRTACYKAFKEQDSRLGNLNELTKNHESMIVHSRQLINEIKQSEKSLPERAKSLIESSQNNAAQLLSQLLELLDNYYVISQSYSKLSNNINEVTQSITKLEQLSWPCPIKPLEVLSNDPKDYHTLSVFKEKFRNDSIEIKQFTEDKKHIEQAAKGTSQIINKISDIYREYLNSKYSITQAPLNEKQSFNEKKLQIDNSINVIGGFIKDLNSERQQLLTNNQLPLYFNESVINNDPLKDHLLKFYDEYFKNLQNEATKYKNAKEALELEFAKSNIDTIHQSIDAIKSEISKFKNDELELVKKHDDNKNKIANLFKKIAEEESSLSSSNDSIDKIDKEIQSLQLQLSSLKSDEPFLKDLSKLLFNEYLPDEDQFKKLAIIAKDKEKALDSIQSNLASSSIFVAYAPMLPWLYSMFYGEKIIENTVDELLGLTTECIKTNSTRVSQTSEAIETLSLELKNNQIYSQKITANISNLNASFKEKEDESIKIAAEIETIKEKIKKKQSSQEVLEKTLATHEINLDITSLIKKIEVTSKKWDDTILNGDSLSIIAQLFKETQEEIDFLTNKIYHKIKEKKLGKELSDTYVQLLSLKETTAEKQVTDLQQKANSEICSITEKISQAEKFIAENNINIYVNPEIKDVDSRVNAVIRIKSQLATNGLEERMANILLQKKSINQAAALVNTSTQIIKIDQPTEERIIALEKKIKECVTRNSVLAEMVSHKEIVEYNIEQIYKAVEILDAKITRLSTQWFKTNKIIILEEKKYLLEKLLAEYKVINSFIDETCNLSAPEDNNLNLDKAKTIATHEVSIKFLQSKVNRLENSWLHYFFGTWLGSATEILALKEEIAKQQTQIKNLHELPKVEYSTSSIIKSLNNNDEALRTLTTLVDPKPALGELHKKAQLETHTNPFMYVFSLFTATPPPTDSIKVMGDVEKEISPVITRLKSKT